MAATASSCRSGSSRTLRTCTCRISSRPRLSGLSTSTWRSKRPARSSAGSRISGRLVAARMITPDEGSKPSISASSWCRVCSFSSCPPRLPQLPRARPRASSSSMKMMAGACLRACSKRSRTRAAPTPTNSSTNSLPDMEKKATPASPATARASRVLPVPGGPTSSTPLGICAPSRLQACGSRKNSTTSTSSCLASSTPATSANLTPVSRVTDTRALPGPIGIREDPP